ncbi:TPA: DNA-processing protein DprA [Serratia fonticola]|nr:DNA-processing protein DprA [Serratia fonticola]
MNLSPVAQATLLLTSDFSRQSEDEVKPLSNAEWGRFALWLKQQSASPADLLSSGADVMLAAWVEPHITRERIETLLSRGHSLALAIERWQRAGLWVLTRSDADYPRLLKQQLRTNAPAVLFGCGDIALLNQPGLAVVGSRNASELDLAFSRQVAGKVASAGVNLISGGARGIDEAAMLGALQHNGTVVGVLSDSLLTAATSAKWRKGLMAGKLLLLSPFYPEAGFTVGNAMARNRYVYCLARSALVVHAGHKGGTLVGAEENLRKKWVPLWVKPTDDVQASNAELVKQGGQWCAAHPDDIDVAQWISPPCHQPHQQEDLLSRAGYKLPDMTAVVNVAQEPEGIWHPSDFYQIFQAQLPALAAHPVTIEDLGSRTGLHQIQLTEWLQRAVHEGLIEQPTGTNCYQWKRKV